MAVYIEVETSSLAYRAQLLGSSDGISRRAGLRSARRPVRGYEIKDDTYAFIKAVDSTGQAIPLISESGTDGRVIGWTDFLIQTASESRMEKHQIIETFGEPYLFFFGEHPRFYDISAVLLNTLDFNWEANWWENYNRYFRGSKLTEMGAHLYIGFDDTLLEGYMLQAQSQKSAQQDPLLVQLSFKLFVTGYFNVSAVGSGDYPVRPTMALPPGIDLTAPLDDNARRRLAYLSTARLSSAPTDMVIGSRIRPLRERIVDNTDEYIGTVPEIETLADPGVLDPFQSLWGGVDSLGALMDSLKDLEALTGALKDIEKAQEALDKLNKLGSMSPKDAWKDLKKTWAKGKKLYNDIGKGIDTFDKESNALFADPEKYATDKWNKSKFGQKVNDAYADAVEWAINARDDASEAAGDVGEFLEKAYAQDTTAKSGGKKEAPPVPPPSDLSTKVKKYTEKRNKATKQVLKPKRPTDPGSNTAFFGAALLPNKPTINTP